MFLHKIAPRIPKNILPHLALLCAMTVWSSSFAALKIALLSFTPLELMAARMAVASTLFLPIAPKLWKKVRLAGSWKLLLLMVIGEPCLYFLFETQALLYTSAAQAGMLVSVLPMVSTTAAFLFLKERTSRGTWIGMGIAGVGVAVLSMGSVATESAPNPLLGNTLEGIAMCCATVYTISARSLSLKYSALEITAIQVFSGLLFFGSSLLLPIEQEHVVMAMDVPTWLPWASVIYLGSIVTFGGYGLYNYGLQYLPVARVESYTSLMPVIGLFFGIVLLGDLFTPIQYAASALVLVGVVIAQKQSRKKV